MNEREVWSDLGSRWRILEQYIKPYPIARWAQPAIEAASRLTASNNLRVSDISRIEIRTFHEALRLGTKMPRNTEEAQYALAFPLAAFLVRGHLGAEEVLAAGLEDPDIVALNSRITVEEDGSFNARFPAERLASVQIIMRDGQCLTSGPASARGDPENSLSDREIHEKFAALAGHLGPERSQAIAEAVKNIDRSRTSQELGELLVDGIGPDSLHAG